MRVFSASNTDIAADVAEGRFRHDLLFHLNTIALRLPPLHDRREAIADGRADRRFAGRQQIGGTVGGG